MRQSNFSRILCILCGAMIMLLSWTVPASAIIMCAHGHSGHIEDESKLTLGKVYYGWGLDFTQVSGSLNWTHFSIPTVFEEKTRYIAIRFATGSADAYISAVAVWNGPTFIMETPPLNWYTTNITTTDVKVIDLGSDVMFESLGISVATTAGIGGASHRFMFHTVCAEFHP